MKPTRSNEEWRRILGRQLAELERIERERAQNEARLQHMADYRFDRSIHDKAR